MNQPTDLAVARLARAYPTLSVQTIERIYAQSQALIAPASPEEHLDAVEQLARTRLDMCEFAEADRAWAIAG